MMLGLFLWALTLAQLAATTGPPQAQPSAPALMKRTSVEKRGVAWQLRNGASLAPFAGLASYYTYSPYGYQSPIAFVPTLWGCSDAHVKEFRDRLAAGWEIVGGTNKSSLANPKEVLAFNEPHHARQANCTPAEAARVWKDVLQPLQAEGWRVSSPAVNTNAWGLAWILDFWRACEGCKPNFLALHFYNPSASELASTLTQWRTTFDLPIQVTEIAPMDWPRREADDLSELEVRQFMQAATAWMDGTPWVEKYYWYGAKWDMGNLNPNLALMNSSTSLSALGRMYANHSSPLLKAEEKLGGAASLRPPLLLLALTALLAVW